jgi:hypothetical protein
MTAYGGVGIGWDRSSHQETHTLLLYGNEKEIVEVGSMMKKVLMENRPAWERRENRHLHICANLTKDLWKTSFATIALLKFWKDVSSVQS